MKLWPTNSGARLVIVLLLFACAVGVGRMIIGRMQNWSVPIQTQPSTR